MRKQFLFLLLIVVSIFTTYAQRMLDLEYEVHIPEATGTISAKKSVAKAPCATNKVVKEGRIWRYHSDINSNMDPEFDIYVDLCLKNTTIIDGKEYLNCYVWKADQQFSEDSAALIAYMREENGKVYVRYIPDAHITALEKGIDIIPYAPMMSILNHDLEALSKTDVLLYDPSLSIGDTLYSTDDIKSSDAFTLSRTEEVECMGQKYTGFFMSEDSGDFYSFFDGIGDLYSLLPLPGSSPITYSVDLWSLMEVIDWEGNVLFDAAKIISGVENITDGDDVIKETYHNINGIEIAEPTHSGVYLKTQILRNGKSITKKVIVR